ncbi:jg4838 [Pararge aegeria aegeria]|uniref:Jg4838 protein n=1 Tax=Pararge aegeria aegeria TaxID=348720 RepID=A0A8S4QUH0_9NEOP|nr:jg4838 [Pararge aegeria aegeria]
MKKNARGSYEIYQEVCDKNRLAVVLWNDNKVVTWVSTSVSTEPVEKIKSDCKQKVGNHLTTGHAIGYEIYEGLNKNRRAVIDPLEIKKLLQKAIQPVLVETPRRWRQQLHIMKCSSNIAY